ncbi:MAG: adenine deaminase C-terminal domain-containing protein [Bacteroidota bacterium]
MNNKVSKTVRQRLAGTSKRARATSAQSLVTVEQPAAPINNFYVLPKKEGDFAMRTRASAPAIRVIEALEGQLITNELQLPAKVKDGFIVSDTRRDILKIVVVNRYEKKGRVAIAFIKNFGLKKGALASTVAHDSHNIIAVGVDDASICAAVNTLIACKGGIAVARTKTQVDCLPLPVGGLMSMENGFKVAADYSRISNKAKELGTPLAAPFMTLSFMALLVIPSLKLSDKGLFDGSKFSFTPLEVKSR